MAILLNTFEGGSDGTTITVGNSGGASGDAFAGVGGSPAFEADATYHDAMGMKAAESTTQRFVYWDGLNNLVVRTSAYVQFASVAPSVACAVVQWRTAAAGVIGMIALNTNGRLIAQVAGGGIVTGTNIAGHAISANNWYRIDAEIIIDGSVSADGNVAYGIYDVNSADTDTPITTRFSGAATLGTTACDRVYFGPMQNAARNGDWLYDTLRAEGGSSTPFGQYSATPTTAWYLLDGVGGSTPMQLGIITA